MIRQNFCICVLLLLRLSQTGKAKSDLIVSVTRANDTFKVSCHLLVETKISQVEWTMETGRVSVSKLGVYHPDHGTSIFPDFKGRVMLKCNETEHRCQLELMGVNVEGREICCIFSTYPYGGLKKCDDLRKTVEPEEMDVMTDPELDDDGRRAIFPWFIGGCLVYLIFIIVGLYLCWRHCCQRRRMFEVPIYLTDDSTQSEELPERCLQDRPLPPLPEIQPKPQHREEQQPPATGFDPSKLYAKIKLDLLYGRLWKAYQNPSRTPAKPHQERPGKVYSLLGEHGCSQVKEEPTRSNPIAMTTGPGSEPSPGLLPKPAGSVHQLVSQFGSPPTPATRPPTPATRPPTPAISPPTPAIRPPRHAKSCHKIPQNAAAPADPQPLPHQTET